MFKIFSNGLEGVESLRVLVLFQSLLKVKYHLFLQLYLPLYYTLKTRTPHVVFFVAVLGMGCVWLWSNKKEERKEKKKGNV